MSVASNLSFLLKQIEQVARHAGRDLDEITLIAVTKGQTIVAIKAAYRVGCRNFGENRIQEALIKIPQTPSDIKWHFIGKLQKNKVNKVIRRFTLIHSVDTLELAQVISRSSHERGVTTSILLESNTSEEATKSGLSPKEWKARFSEVLNLKAIEVKGLMTIAPLTEDKNRIRRCFSSLRLLRDELQNIARERADLSILSMGMSHDFSVAIQEGATLVRIGTAIFTPQ